MKITTVPIAVLRFQYQLVRLPLQMIEDTLIARMGAQSPARLFYERSFGVLDSTLGAALGDSGMEKRGAALAERSDLLARAARLDAAASQKQVHADAELKAKRDEALEDRTLAREAKQQKVEEARSEAEEQKRAAAESAQKRTAMAKQHADVMATQRIDSAEDAKRGAQARILAAEQKAAAAADSKLKDAQVKRDQAESTRAQADLVHALAEAEKQKRQTARASKS